MADIDKGLPSNTRTKIDVPTEEEIEEVSVKEEEVEKGPVEVTPEEDGGATIDFEPGAINIPGTENHFDNLADILPEDVLQPDGNDMVGDYNDYKASRKEWEQSYREGFGMAALEASSCGLPVVGTNIHGLSDAVINNDYCVILLSPSSSIGLTGYSPVK